MMSVTLRYGDIKGCQVLLINEHNDDGKRCNAAMFIMLLLLISGSSHAFRNNLKAADRHFSTIKYLKSFGCEKSACNIIYLLILDFMFFYVMCCFGAINDG